MKTPAQKQRDGSPWGTIILLLILAGIIVISFLYGCTREETTGIEYENMLGVITKVEIYQVDGSMVGTPSHRINQEEITLLETIYAKPFETLFVELPAGHIKTEYTPEGCWRVLPDIVSIDPGQVHRDSLWFAFPLWN